MKVSLESVSRTAVRGTGSPSVPLDTDRLPPRWERPRHSDQLLAFVSLSRVRKAVLFSFALLYERRCIFGESNGPNSLEVGGEGTVGIG